MSVICRRAHSSPDNETPDSSSERDECWRHATSISCQPIITKTLSFLPSLVTLHKSTYFPSSQPLFLPISVALPLLTLSPSLSPHIVTRGLVCKNSPLLHPLPRSLAALHQLTYTSRPYTPPGHAALLTQSISSREQYCEQVNRV